MSGTIQVVDSTGKTYAARRIVQNGVQIYPPTGNPLGDGTTGAEPATNAVVFGDTANVSDLGEEILYIGDAGVVPTTPPPTTTAAPTTTPEATTTTQQPTTTTQQPTTTTQQPTTTTSSPTTTGAKPGQVCLHVKGMTGDSAALNGDWTLTWEGDSYTGGSTLTGTGFSLAYVTIGSISVWQVQADCLNTIAAYWSGGAGSQDPNDPASGSPFAYQYGPLGSSMGTVTLTDGPCSTSTTTGAPTTTAGCCGYTLSGDDTLNGYYAYAGTYEGRALYQQQTGVSSPAIFFDGGQWAVTSVFIGGPYDEVYTAPDNGEAYPPASGWTDGVTLTRETGGCVDCESAPTTTTSSGTTTASGTTTGGAATTTLAGTTTNATAGYYCVRYQIGFSTFGNSCACYDHYPQAGFDQCDGYVITSVNGGPYPDLATCQNCYEGGGYPCQTTTTSAGTTTAGAAQYCVSGAGSTDYNGTYTQNGTYNGAPAFELDGSHWLWWNSGPALWVLSNALGSGFMAYTASGTPAAPTLGTYQGSGPSDNAAISMGACPPTTTSPGTTTGAPATTTTVADTTTLQPTTTVAPTTTAAPPDYTASGAGTASVNGGYYLAGAYNGQNYYTNAQGVYLYYVNTFHYPWAIDPILGNTNPLYECPRNGGITGSYGAVTGAAPGPTLVSG